MVVSPVTVNTGEVLTTAMRKIAQANQDLAGVFTVDWNQPAPDGSGNKLIDTAVVNALIEHFRSLPNGEPLDLSAGEPQRSGEQSSPPVQMPRQEASLVTAQEPSAQVAKVVAGNSAVEPAGRQRSATLPPRQVSGIPWRIPRRTSTATSPVLSISWKPAVITRWNTWSTPVLPVYTAVIPKCRWPPATGPIPR